MKNTLLKYSITFCIILFSTTLFAQNKKEMLADIETLKNELATTKEALVTAKKAYKVSTVELEIAKEQLTDSQEENKSLLANMGNFTALSSQKSKNLEKSLESIKRKDQQINTINKAITAQDSIKLATLTLFRNSVGSDANVAIKNGIVFLSLSNASLFGSDDNYVITEGGKKSLQKIAAALNKYPNYEITVEGNSNAINFPAGVTNNWDLSSTQASSVADRLQKEFTVAPKRITVVGKSEYATEGIETQLRILINPEFDEFYSMVKDQMKTSSK